MLNEVAPRTRPNRDDVGHVPGGSDIQTPFADEVLRLRRTRPLSEPIVSFHALPWGQGRCLAGAGPIGEKYRQPRPQATPRHGLPGGSTAPGCRRAARITGGNHDDDHDR